MPEVVRALHVALLVLDTAHDGVHRILLREVSAPKVLHQNEEVCLVAGVMENHSGLVAEEAEEHAVVEGPEADENIQGTESGHQKKSGLHSRRRRWTRSD